MPLSEADKAIACQLVFADWRIKLAGLSPNEEQCGKLAEAVWAYCESTPRFVEQLGRNRDRTVKETTDHIRGLDNARELVGFVPIWLVFLIKIIISILIDYWLLRKAPA